MAMESRHQRIKDKLRTAWYIITANDVNLTIYKATTGERLAPKKKHLGFLLDCTKNTDVSMVKVVKRLMERLGHINSGVNGNVLITIHCLMNFGDKRFSIALALSNLTLDMVGLMEKKGKSLISYYSSAQCMKLVFKILVIMS